MFYMHIFGEESSACMHASEKESVACMHALEENESYAYMYWEQNYLYACARKNLYGPEQSKLRGVKNFKYIYLFGIILIVSKNE